MRTFEIEVTVPADRRLTIELPQDFEMGSYQVVVVMNPNSEAQPIPQSGHELNALAGQVRAFADVDAVSWQRQVRNDWNDD